MPALIQISLKTQH